MSTFEGDGKTYGVGMPVIVYFPAAISDASAFRGAATVTLAVSLGKATTPTYLGTGVVMAKSDPEEMTSDPGEEPVHDIEVPWPVRVTDDGEFIHDASWNGSIGSANLSHGCTNLEPADAEWYYGFAQIGDPVTWTNTGTDQVIPVGDGWGDWNADWATWSQGGLLPTTAG